MSNEDFVRAWQSSETILEVQNKTGLSKDAVSRKAKDLRYLGVKLRRMSKGGLGVNKVDTTALNKLIDELAQPSVPPRERRKGLSSQEWAQTIEALLFPDKVSS